VICADADLNGYAIDFVRECRGFVDSEESLDVIHLERQDTRVLYENDKVLKDKVLGDLSLNKRIWVVSTSKGEVKKMDKMIKAVHPDKVGVVIHSDIEGKENIIANIDQIILETKPDYVLVSPTVQAGVSVDLDQYFDYVAGFYRSGIVTSTTFDQMLGRVRKPVSRVAHVWVDKRNMGGATDESIVLENLYNRDRICAAAIGYVARSGSPEKIIYTSGGYRLQQSKESEIYNRFYSAQVAMENARGVSCATSGYIAYLRANGVRYMWFGDDTPSKEVLEAYKEAAEAVKQQDIDEVKGAEEISIVKAQSLVEEETTPEERKQIARAYVLATYGEVNDFTVKLYDGGKGRRSLKNLALTVDLIQGGDWVTLYDLSQRHNGLACATFQNLTPFIFLASEILREFGVLNDDGNAIYSSIRNVQKYRIRYFVELLEELGFKVNVKVAVKNPARMVSSVCSKLGLKLACKQKRVNGKRVREYSLDKSLTEFLLGTPYWDELRVKRIEYNQERSKVVSIQKDKPSFSYKSIKFNPDGTVKAVVMFGSETVIPFDMLSEVERTELSRKYQKVTTYEKSLGLEW